MNGQDRPRQRRLRRSGSACNNRDGRGRLSARGGESSLSGRTTTRALIAVGTYVAQDLRDAEGLMRPVLRRAAIRLALSRREPARRLGYAYLHLDPPAPEALPARVEVIDTTSASPPHPAIAVEPGTGARLTSGEATI